MLKRKSIKRRIGVSLLSILSTFTSGGCSPLNTFSAITTGRCFTAVHVNSFGDYIYAEPVDDRGIECGMIRLYDENNSLVREIDAWSGGYTERYCNDPKVFGFSLDGKLLITVFHYSRLAHTPQVGDSEISTFNVENGELVGRTSESGFYHTMIPLSDGILLGKEPCATGLNFLIDSVSDATASLFPFLEPVQNWRHLSYAELGRSLEDYSPY